MDWEAFYAEFRKPGFVPGYEIQNRLGGGAFGEVYKARKESIGKAYAIKFLKIDDEAQRDAIERELEQVRHFAAIDHPNLVTIEDLGKVMDVPYLVMGYAGDDTLSRRLRKEPLDPERALLFFVQACRGVLALHDRRLVHFDIKPGNVFLKGDIARVGDYGLSKLMIDGRLTLSFGRGTPQYMAPEMLRNRADHRADIYSLGVVLYESITGKLPFEGQGQSGLVLRETDSPPPFPDSFPSGLQSVVERCLRLNPDERYANVSELLVAMGQTARPGDSVLRKLPEGEAAQAWATPKAEPAKRVGLSGEVAGAPDAPVSDLDMREGSSTELRQTAAELARGAREVARGVWDGLRGGSEVRPVSESTGHAGEPSSSEVKAESAWGSEAPDVGFGRELTQSDGGITTHAAVGAPPRAAVRDSLSPPPGTRPPAPPAHAGAMTIPVPPRTAGGFVGTMLSTLLLGFEILVSLVTGFLRAIERFVTKRGQAKEAKRLRNLESQAAPSAVPGLDFPLAAGEGSSDSLGESSPRSFLGSFLGTAFRFLLVLAGAFLLGGGCVFVISELIG